MNEKECSLKQLAVLSQKILSSTNDRELEEIDLDTQRKIIRNTLKQIEEGQYSFFFRTYLDKKDHHCPESSAYVLIFLSLPIDSQYEKNDKTIQKLSPFSRANKFNFNLMMDMSEEDKQSLVSSPWINLS